MPRRGRAVGRAPSSSPTRALGRLVDRASDIIFRVRLAPRPRLEFVNPAVRAVTGYSQDEWYADAGLALRIIHPADRRKLQDLVRSRRVPPQSVSLRWTRKDGALVRTEIAAVPIYGRQGALVAVEGIARDVSARRGNGDVARVNDRFLRLAFDHLPTGAAHMAGDGRFLHVNRRLCELTGFSPEELLARHFRDIAHPDDADRHAVLLQQLRSSDLPQVAIENRVTCKDGSQAWVRVTASRLRSAGGGEAIVVVDPIAAPAREGEQRRLTCYGIDVDADRLEVTWNARRVPLTLKEVLLLRYLIRHRSEMLARDRLLHDVWGYEHAGRSRTLDVHICRLRRKLPPLADSLVTIGHFGYTLSEHPAGAQPAGVASR